VRVRLRFGLSALPPRIRDRTKTFACYCVDVQTFGDRRAHSGLATEPERRTLLSTYEPSQGYIHRMGSLGLRQFRNMGSLAGHRHTHEVFGVSNTVLVDSYVDRGALDEELRRYLERPLHVALRGASKCGKSWLRQTVLPEALTVQCRLKKTTLDIYRDALSQLQIKLEVESTAGTTWNGHVEAQGDVGIKILARLRVRAAVDAEKSGETKTATVGHDISDLRFIADVLKESGRRLVIEDFHYLSVEERRAFAFDLKALWDYGVFVVVVGVWSEQNMLLFLNPDLTGRVLEVPIVWTESDLGLIFERGGRALNLRFSEGIRARATADCFENAGILQQLILGTLDELGIVKGSDQEILVENLAALESAAMAYAEQLNALYQQFAGRVSGGIRTRQNSTGIYAHAIATVMAEPDDSLIRGVSIDRIFAIASAREPRIQKGNLHTVLDKIERLQVDDEGRGLVLAYNEANREISVVDRQLLLYRKYSTVSWPWDELIAEHAADSDFEADQTQLALDV
jgi:hypothetical protein